MGKLHSLLLKASIAIVIFSIGYLIAAYLLLPAKNSMFAEVLTELSYLGLAIYTFYHLFKMNMPIVAIGWSLFCFSLALDLSDEIVDVSGLLHKNFEDWIAMLGIFIFAVGFHRANTDFSVTLDKEQARSETLSDKAFTDELTGISNRAHLLEHLQVFCKNSQPYVIYFIDLNKFKPANDTHGHEVGDMLLKAVSIRLDRIGRSEDMLARWGGDEFIYAVKQSTTNKIDAMEFAQRITTTFIKPFHVRNLSIELGASVGFASYPEHGGSKEDVIHKADLSMYHSKQKGDGPSAYDPSLTV